MQVGASGSNCVEVLNFFFVGGGGAGRLFAIAYIAMTTALIISSFKICISTFHIIFIPLLLLNDVIMMSNYIINNN